MIAASSTGKIFAGKTSFDADPTSATLASAEKVLIPGGEADEASSPVESVVSLELSGVNILQLLALLYPHCESSGSQLD